jgi:hypothetical protein
LQDFAVVIPRENSRFEIVATSGVPTGLCSINDKATELLLDTEESERATLRSESGDIFKYRVIHWARTAFEHTIKRIIHQNLPISFLGTELGTAFREEIRAHAIEVCEGIVRSFRDFLHGHGVTVRKPQNCYITYKLKYSQEVWITGGGAECYQLQECIHAAFSIPTWFRRAQK